MRFLNICKPVKIYARTDRRKDGQTDKQTDTRHVWAKWQLISYVDLRTIITKNVINNVQFLKINCTLLDSYYTHALFYVPLPFSGSLIKRFNALLVLAIVLVVKKSENWNRDNTIDKTSIQWRLRHLERVQIGIDQAIYCVINVLITWLIWACTTSFPLTNSFALSTFTLEFEFICLQLFLFFVLRKKAVSLKSIKNILVTTTTTTTLNTCN